GVRAGDDLVSEGLESREAELLHELHETIAPHAASRDLSVEVAHHEVGHAHVGADHRLQGLADPSRLVELHDGDEEAFLVDLARLGREDVAADVRGVAGGGGESYEGAAAGHGVADGDVVEGPRGLSRVVGDDHIAGGPGFEWIDIEDVLHGERHGVDVPRRSRHRLRHHPTAAVEDARGEIARLAHDGGEGGAHQGGGLLVHHADETV